MEKLESKKIGNESEVVINGTCDLPNEDKLKQIMSTIGIQEYTIKNMNYGIGIRNIIRIRNERKEEIRVILSKKNRIEK